MPRTLYRSLSVLTRYFCNLVTWVSHLSYRFDFSPRIRTEPYKWYGEGVQKEKIGYGARSLKRSWLLRSKAGLRRCESQGGYTLVELLIIAPILMITIVVIMSYLFSQYGQLTQQGALINMRTEAQTITFSMQDDVFFAERFAQNKNTNLVDTYAPSGGWRYNTNPQTLIISAPALTANRRAEDRRPVYINTLGCGDGVIDQNEPLFNNIIYFVQGTNLYKRVLSAPSNMQTCDTSYMDQTCPANHATSTCKADVKLTNKLNKFQVTYYQANNTVTTNPDLAEKIKVYIQLKDRAFAEDIFADSSITLKRMNQ